MYAQLRRDIDLEGPLLPNHIPAGTIVEIYEPDDDGVFVVESLDQMAEFYVWDDDIAIIL